MPYCKNDHRAFALTRENPKGLVVFIHGFMGSPRYFDDMARAVFCAGYDARALLLPGHGGSGADFAACRAEAWQTHVTEALRAFSGEYETVFAVGHSMGCLLALNASVEPGVRVSRMFFIAPALRLRFASPRFAAAFLSMALPSGAEQRGEYVKNCGVPLSLGLLLRSLRPSAELKRLISVTEPRLKEVTAPVRAVFSYGDETVSPRAGAALARGLENAPFSAVYLTKSRHTWAEERERRIVFEELLAFLK